VPAEPRILIIGAGPTGIGAACRLIEHGHENWLLVDSADQPGGLASSVIDSAGFTWDLGGHVLFSHYRYFDALMDRALGDEWLEHEREAWVRIRERWVPYPFQNNLWRLPADDITRVIDGLVSVANLRESQPANFREWLLQSFGPGLCDLFMYPYNRKVWAYDPAELDTGWMGERVATVDLERVRRNVAVGRDEVSWGPNATFRFPRSGGTGEIWRRLFAGLPADRAQLGRRVTGVHSGTRTVRFADGRTDGYDYLISTMPLDLLLGIIDDAPALSRMASHFVHSSSHIVGIGLDGPVPADLATKCWMYFPESNTPFYRATVFSNYSPNNTPRPGKQWSLMAEVSESPAKPVIQERVIDDVVAGCRAAGLLGPAARILSTWHARLEHGYPTPWLGRDETLEPIHDALERVAIFSRGRFGAWKYEVSNQDHSTMQGVEAVDAILLGVPESTVHGRMDREPPTFAGPGFDRSGAKSAP
jgi:protoporphyrinogen oxidase